VHLLYIDSSHEREETLAEVRAWRPLMAPGSVIVFDDYANPIFRGVTEAVAELGITGERVGRLFVTGSEGLADRGSKRSAAATLDHGYPIPALGFSRERT
jgi:hypothetical protein